MDTSETFVKMCEKAEEIQALSSDYWDKFSIGCWYSPNHIRCKGHFEDWHMAYKYCPVCAKELEITPLYSICLCFQEDDNIWLPRQDQLQEMVSDKYTITECWHPNLELSIWNVCTTSDFRLDEASLGDSDRRDRRGLWFDSAEQAWLAFVMKEKYNKVWNGEDWT